MNTTPSNPPKSIHELYTFYLSPAHLENKPPARVTIERAEIRDIYNAQLNKDVPEMVVHFRNARRSLKCNKTQTETLWEISGTDDHTQWAGLEITLERIATKRGGKFTIKISKPTE